MIKEIVETAGMAVSFAHEDLVFLDHNGFLLQFTDNDKEVLIHLNAEADKEVISRDVGQLAESAVSHDMRFVQGSFYSLYEEEDDSIRIEFDEAC